MISYLRSVSGADLLELFLKLILVLIQFYVQMMLAARDILETQLRVKWIVESLILLYRIWRAPFNCGRTNKVKRTINLLLTWLVNYFSPLLLLTCEFWSIVGMFNELHWSCYKVESNCFLLFSSTKFANLALSKNKSFT